MPSQGNICSWRIFHFQTSSPPQRPSHALFTLNSMAFQTNVFRDGEWVTETVNLHAVLESQKATPKGQTQPDLLKPPRCGLLTRTLVGSARANLILPARLRSPDHNDIAFIGVSVAGSSILAQS